MKITLRLVLLCSLILLQDSESVFGQIGGITGGKIAAFHAAVTVQNTVEFEPTLTHQRIEEFWDQDGKLVAQGNDTQLNTQLQWRLSWGAFENLEIGATINNVSMFSSNLSMVGLGAKYFLLGTEIIDFGIAAGLNAFIGNGNIDRDFLKPQYIAGVTSTLKIIDETTSADISYFWVTSSSNPSNENPPANHYFNLDLGHKIYDSYVLVLGVGYQDVATVESITASKWTLYPGVSIESGNNFIIALSYPFDIAGKGLGKTSGIAATLTMMFQ